MAEIEEVDSLKRRLRREGAGPIAELSHRAMDAATARGREFGAGCDRWQTTGR
jgi:hypothetical protein